MTELELDLLKRMMDRVAQEHSYSPARAELSIEGNRLLCKVGREVVERHAGTAVTF